MSLDYYDKNKAQLYKYKNTKIKTKTKMASLKEF